MISNQTNQKYVKNLELLGKNFHTVNNRKQAKLLNEDYKADIYIDEYYSKDFPTIKNYKPTF